MRRRISALFFIFVLMAAISVPAFAKTQPLTPIISWTDDPATTQTIVWRAEVSSASFVEYATEAQYSRSGFSGAARAEASCTDVSPDGSGAWRFEAEMTGLAPATRYTYRVGNESGWSEAASFMTADPAVESFSFVYMGDIQVVNNAEAEYALWGELAQTAYAKAPDIAFGLFGGDIVESGLSLQQFDYFLQAASPVFGSVALMPTNGNHESNFPGGKPEMYLDVFALPRNGPEGFEGEFYSFDYGNCHVTVVNSWVYSGEQRLTDDDYARIADWIEDDLRGSGAVWKIVLTHIPVYAVHRDGTSDAMREAWAPIFERNGVSLVFVGHQHVYSRSYPIYDGRIDQENGVVYVMGVAGQKFYGTADERLSERTVYNVSNYQMIRIDGDTLTLQSFDIDGNELDYCVLSPRASDPQPAGMSMLEAFIILWKIILKSMIS